MLNNGNSGARYIYIYIGRIWFYTETGVKGDALTINLVHSDFYFNVCCHAGASIKLKSKHHLRLRKKLSSTHSEYTEAKVMAMCDETTDAHGAKNGDRT